MTDDSLKTALVETQGRAPWGMLQEHANRGGLIMVAPELDLLQVGLAVAQDRGDLVGAWLSTGKLWKPTELQTQTYALDERRQYPFVIVQPYVLATDVGVPMAQA